MRSWTLLLVAAVLVTAAPVVAEMTDTDMAAFETTDDDVVSAAVDAPVEAPAQPGTDDEDMALVEADTEAAIDESAEFETSVAGSAVGADVETEASGAATTDDVMLGSPSTGDAVASEPVVLDDMAARNDDSGLGPVAVDAKGQKGRIHTVVSGDTLWDISTAYLGTPWVWPSVWKDNGEIANPHVINPGDRIWITAGEMRIVSDREADEMIAAEQEVAAVAPPEPEWEVEPAPPAAAATDMEEDLMADEMPASMDNLPVAVPLQAKASEESGRTIFVAERDSMGFVTTEAVDAATSIVDSPSPRTWLVDGDLFYLGKGEGEVAVGDEFTLFRDVEGVVDGDTGRLLGYHVEILGWAVVRKVNSETATAEIRMSRSEIRRGDQMTPRVVNGPTVPVRVTPDGIEGRIVYMPDSRTSMGDSDYVYLNRGSLHGFEVGSEVEVFTPGELEVDRARNAEVMTPDHVAAHMVLVEVQPDSSVAYIVSSSRELEMGDMIRPATRRIASR